MAKKAKTISVEKVKSALKNRHDEIMDALAYSRASGHEEIVPQFAREKDVVLDIARDLFGADSYCLEEFRRSIGGVDCTGRHLAWLEGGEKR